MESSHIGPMILEPDCQVTHEDEKIQDEEYESVMIYCRVLNCLEILSYEKSQSI
jgi:hypothetical protein